MYTKHTNISLGDIPSYSTKPAHVIQMPSMTKRDTDDRDAVHYMVQTADEMYYLTFNFLCSFIVQQRNENGSLESMNVSRRNCYYTGRVVSRLFSRVAVSMCDGEMVRKEILIIS